MGKPLQYALALAVLVIAGAVAFTAWRLSVALDSLGAGSAQTLSSLNTTLDAINRPCNTGKPCGTLANLNKSLAGIDTAVVHFDLVARHEQQQLGTIDGYTSQLVSHINGVADSLQRAAEATTGTAQAATLALGTANESIRGLQPLEASLTGTATASTETINTFNGRLSDPRIDSLLDHLDATSAHVDGTLGDVQKIADKTSGDILAPKPWWQKIGPYANDVVRAGCLITGRCP